MTAPASVPSANEPVSRFYIPASAAVGIARANVLKNGDCFAILDPFGNAQATGPAAEGLFFEDTRYLSQLALTIDGMRPLLLSSSVSEDNDILEADLTNPDLIENGRLRSPRDTVHILSRTTLGEDALFARLELRNFALTPAGFRLAVHVDADFVDIFELRGTVRRRRGRLLRHQQTHDGVVLAYIGRDRLVRRMRLVADPAPHWAAPRRLEWKITLAPGDTATVQLTARCERGDGRSSGASRKASLAAVARRRAEREKGAAALTSSNELFNDLLSRSRADLDMLVTTTPEGLYADAGIPWFSTPFGRDGLITALECLWLDPALAAGTLRFLAAAPGDGRSTPRPMPSPGRSCMRPARAKWRCWARCRSAATTAASMRRRSSSCWPPPITRAPATSSSSARSGPISRRRSPG